MRIIQLAIFGIAGIAGLGAFMLMQPQEQPAPPPEAAAPALPTSRVLVASRDLNTGTAIGTADLRWQDWPQDAALGSTSYVTEAAAPNGIDEWTGAVVRTPFVAGEPIRAQKVIKAGGSGFLAAMLPAGMRAVTIAISVDTAAGGFILPNDRVDVIMARRDSETSKQTGTEAWNSETILRDVRILAIDQQISDKEGEQTIKGATATLELSPKQAETIALAKAMGTLSLSLRPLAESKPPSALGVSAIGVGGRGVTSAEIANGGADPDNGMAVVRYGSTPPSGPQTAP